MKRRLSALCLSLLVGLHTAPAYTGTIDLPSIGDPSGGVISPEQERRLGEALMRNVRQNLRVIEDPQVNEYVQSLGYQLVANSDEQAHDFTFFVLQDGSINAFAAPGGFVGVHSGLILATENESELAAVLAHEIAHITQRHMARTYEAAGRLNLPMAAALLAAILLGSSNGQLGEAALAAATAGSAQYQVNFTRGNEQEADRIGIQMLAHSGFDARSMPTFFERLQQTARYYGNTLPEFLSTHPVTVNRIADSTSRAEQYPRRPASENVSYRLMKARLLVLTADNPQQALKIFEERLKSVPPRNADAERYGYALALHAVGRLPEARAQLEQLQKKDPDRIAYRIARAEVELAMGNAARARAIYADSLQLYAGNYPLTLHYTETLLKSGEAAKARDVLQRYMRNREPSPEVYRLLAQAAGESGARGEAHYAMGEHYYLNGQIEAAIDQLTLALRFAEDFYQTARIEARLQQLKEEALLAKNTPKP